MPSADFCTAVRDPRGALSPSRTRCRSPGVSLTAFTAHLPNLQPGLVVDTGLRGSGPARPTQTASYSVPVRQVAALLPRFLQTAPRGHRPCASLALGLHQSVDPAGRRLTGRALSRRLVLAMIKRRAAAADLPPSTCCHTFRATGITAYLSNGGTLEHAQQIAGQRLPEDDEALRPDGGHDHRRRDRAHRDLGGGRPARRRAPRDGRAARRDGRAASCRVRHGGCRVARTRDSGWRLRLVPPGGWGCSAARRWRAAPTRVGSLWPHTRSVRK